MNFKKEYFNYKKNNASQRYSDLLKNQPEYTEKTPFQYLASYLGASQRHSSCIRQEFLFRQMSYISKYPMKIFVL